MAATTDFKYNQLEQSRDFFKYAILGGLSGVVLGHFVFHGRRIFLGVAGMVVGGYFGFKNYENKYLISKEAKEKFKNFSGMKNGKFKRKKVEI